MPAPHPRAQGPSAADVVALMQTSAVRRLQRRVRLMLRRRGPSAAQVFAAKRARPHQGGGALQCF